VGEGEEILAPLEGKFYRVKNAQEEAKNVGDRVKAGDIIGYIEAMKTYNAIRAEFDGTITAILVNSGDSVEEDDPIMKIAK
jgi:pyruvate carboxylase subunit B